MGLPVFPVLTRVLCMIVLCSRCRMMLAIVSPQNVMRRYGRSRLAAAGDRSSMPLLCVLSTA